MIDVLIKTAPILFCALAFLIAWKGGILNIGADGQFLAGALAATAVTTRLHAPGGILLFLALLSGVLAGALWAGIAAWLQEKRGVLDVLSTILLNFIAAGLVSIAVRGFLQERAGTFPQSDAIPAAARLPDLLPGTRLHAGIALAVVLSVGFALFLTRTRAGFRLRAAGANREAAAFAGMAVTKIRVAAFLVSGGVAGLGGACELLGVTGRLFESFSNGYGYIGLAAAVVGGSSPAGMIIASLGFGALNSLGSLFERRLGVSSVVVFILEAILLLVALAWPRVRRSFRDMAKEKTA